MEKTRTIQIKNADKIFKQKSFKMRRHDFVILMEDIEGKLSIKEKRALENLLNQLESKWGDYELYVQVYPSKIKITDLLEE